MRGHCSYGDNKWNALSAHKTDVVWVAHYLRGSTWCHKKPALMRRVAVAPFCCDSL